MMQGTGADYSYWQRASKSIAPGLFRGTASRSPKRHAHERSPAVLGRGDSVATRFDVSADLPPASALNPAYEYALPHHLALNARPPTSHLQSSSDEAGSTVVSAPHTVGPSENTVHLSTGRYTKDHIDTEEGGVVGVNQASGTGYYYNASECKRDGNVLRSLADGGKVSKSGKLPPASHACQQRGHASYRTRN